MPYVLRDAAGKIQAVNHAEIAPNGWEKLESESKDYQVYLEEEIRKANVFRESDIQLARVLEDLISLLIDRDFIRFTDFPEPAQKRLIERQGLRMKNAKLNLLDDDHHLTH